VKVFCKKIFCKNIFQKVVKKVQNFQKKVKIFQKAVKKCSKSNQKRGKNKGLFVDTLPWTPYQEILTKCQSDGRRSTSILICIINSLFLYIFQPIIKPQFFQKKTIKNRKILTSVKWVVKKIDQKLTWCKWRGKRWP